MPTLSGPLVEWSLDRRAVDCVVFDLLGVRSSRSRGPYFDPDGGGSARCAKAEKALGWAKGTTKGLCVPQGTRGLNCYR
jgi:hypothetical protein